MDTYKYLFNEAVEDFEYDHGREPTLEEIQMIEDKIQDRMQMWAERYAEERLSEPRYIPEPTIQEVLKGR